MASDRKVLSRNFAILPSLEHLFTLLQVRLFHFLTGKLHLVLDEGLQLYSDLQQVYTCKKGT